MTAYAPGDGSRAVCASCGPVSTTFVLRDVPFDDGGGPVRGILVAACDACGATVAVPAQSTPAIKAARADLARAKAEEGTRP